MKGWKRTGKEGSGDTESSYMNFSVELESRGMERGGGSQHRARVKSRRL